LANHSNDGKSFWLCKSFRVMGNHWMNITTICLVMNQ
jgi:hypothetical protein